MLGVTLYYSAIFFYVRAVDPYNSFVFPCLTPNNEDGLCLSLLSCPSLLKELGTLKSSAIKFVEQSKCPNNIPNTIIVCCGKSSRYNYNVYDLTVPTEKVPLGVTLPILPTTITESSSTNGSISPSTESRSAITTETVPCILTSRATTITESSTTNLPIITSTESSTVTLKADSEDSILSNATTSNAENEATNQTSSTQQNFNEILVAVTNLTIIRVNSSVLEHRDYAKRRLLPSRTFCGLQHTDDRYYFDNNTALDEFPWVAHIIFIEDSDEDTEQYLDRCNGVLISNRYVLTSEYCGTYASAVRLGQHSINQTVSCTNDTDVSDCNEPRIDNKVVEEIHRKTDPDAYHDFTLLRLAGKVAFTDFIRPICLNLDYPDVPNTHDSLIFTGWGATVQENTVKKRLTYNVTQNIDECLMWNDRDLKNASARGEVVCLIPRESGGELVCPGDEGGPLTYSHRFQWFAEGLITRVHHKSTDEECSNERPISGLKITSDVLNWILDNMHD